MQRRMQRMEKTEKTEKKERMGKKMQGRIKKMAKIRNVRIL